MAKDLSLEQPTINLTYKVYCSTKRIDNYLLSMTLMFLNINHLMILGLLEIIMDNLLQTQAPRLFKKKKVKIAITASNGRAAVQKGDWKIVFISKPKGTEKWQLYNLAKDLGEVHDLAEQDPKRMEELIKCWDQYVLGTGVIPLAPELGEWMAAMEEQMPENAWIEYEYVLKRGCE